MHGSLSLRTSARIVALLLCASVRLAQAESPELLQSPASEWLGAPSCSARSCHGSTGAGRSHPIVWGNEHTIWLERDRHRQAYASLLSPLGQQIAQRLELGPAQQARQCLVCHAPAALDERAALGAGLPTPPTSRTEGLPTPPTSRTEGLPESPGDLRSGESGSVGDRPQRAGRAAGCTPSFVTEGVGCEACHGPAQRWIAAHTAADWGLLSPLERERDLGFRNTKDLATRAGVCSECHVGTARGDVNHDLIAAGHPRLTFEFASHLNRLPRHWDEKGENDRRLRPAFEASAWTIGQIAAAKSQLELLAARAAAAAEVPPRAVWPEFAEYSCYTCHRSLGKSVVNSAGPLGRPTWGTWHFPLLPLVGQMPANVDSGLAAISQRMSALSADKLMAADEALSAAQELDQWLTAVSTAPIDESQLREQLARLTTQGPDLVHGEWDIAAQLYLALCAWQQARLDVRQRLTPEDQAIQRLLGETRRDLCAPPAEFGHPPDEGTKARSEQFIERLRQARRRGLLGRH